MSAGLKGRSPVALLLLTVVGVAGCAGRSATPVATSEVRSQAATPSQSAPAPSATLTGEVQVAARDLAFTPSQFEVPSTGSTRIVVRNDGFVVHNLTIDDLGIQIVVSRGGVGEATLTDPPAGTYVFYCSVSGHRLAGMEGSLVVS